MFNLLNLFNMNEINEQKINSKLEELQKYLKIDTSENSWEYDLQKELKVTNIYFNIFRVIGLIIMVASAIIALIAFFADDLTILGFEIKEIYLPIFFLIAMLFNLLITQGKMELKKDRIKTFLLLKELNKGT